MATRDKRIRSKNLSEEERAAQVAVTFRIPNELKQQVAELAAKRDVSQNVQFAQSIRDGLELNKRIGNVRRCLMRSDPDILPYMQGATVPHLPKEYEQMIPSDEECMRFIDDAIRAAVLKRHEEFETLKELGI